VLIVIYVLLLPEGQTGEAWDPPEKQSYFKIVSAAYKQLHFISKQQIKDI
jgi:hypothetical protein